MHRAHVVLFVSLVAACSAAPLQPPVVVTALPVPRQTPLRPAALRVLQGDREAASLAPAGGITIDGRPFAQMEPWRVVDLAGTELATLSPDGTLRFRGAARDARLTDHGAIADADTVMSLAEDGSVRFTRTASGDALSLRLRVEGVTPASRAAAALLVGVVMFRARTSRTDAPEAP